MFIKTLLRNAKKMFVNVDKNVAVMIISLAYELLSLLCKPWRLFIM